MSFAQRLATERQTLPQHGLGLGDATLLQATRGEVVQSVHGVGVGGAEGHTPTLVAQQIQCILSHCIALHYITLHYITLHYITLHYITLHYITLHYITLNFDDDDDDDGDDDDNKNLSMIIQI